MIVTPKHGKLGGVVAYADDVLLLFERRARQPEAGREVDVMVCASLGYRASRVDPQVMVIPALVVRPVEDDDFLLDHTGFECAGTMCRTTAHVTEASDARLKAVHGRTVGWLTPGRTPVAEVSNVNARFEGREPTPKIPGKAYVNLADVREGRQRISGVPDLDHVDRHVLSMLVRNTPKVRERML